MIGVLSDAHGNKYAFIKALKYMRFLGVRSFYFLGDAIGYVPSISVLDELMKLGQDVKCVLGNHEEMFLDGSVSDEKDSIYQLKCVKGLISSKHKNFIGSWPTCIRESIANKQIMFVHGSPTNHTQGYIYPDTDLDQFKIQLDYVFVGHTHRPFVKQSNDITFVNVGSCGLPRDDGRYGSFAIFDPCEEKVQIYRFSIEDCIEKLSKATLALVHDSVLNLTKRRSNRIEGIVLK